MILGGQELFNDLKLYRLVSIVGFRGAGKDLLASEMSKPFLEKGYKFYSNQLHIWNDRLYVSDRDVYLSRYRGDKRFPNFENVPVVAEYPDVRRRVVILSEAGRYLRTYACFEDC
jgi:hypothetical protein